MRERLRLMVTVNKLQVQIKVAASRTEVYT